MPKVVDHAQRRSEIIDAVWTLIARRGFASFTMRDLATELGMANGALARYFPSKEAILRATLDRTNASTDARAAVSIGNRTGVDALRRLCLEIMPLDEVRLDEARVVIGFWGYTAPIPDLAAIFDRAMQGWRSRMVEYLREAITDGEVRTDLATRTTVDTIMATMMGLQINALFSPGDTTPGRQIAVLDHLLSELRLTTSSGSL